MVKYNLCNWSTGPLLGINFFRWKVMAVYSLQIPLKYVITCLKSKLQLTYWINEHLVYPKTIGQKSDDANMGLLLDLEILAMFVR
jgi:hypothetical protein